MKAIRILFFLMVIYSVHTACQKNDSPPPSTKTVAERLTQQTWIFQEAGLDGDKNGTVDQQDPYLQSCKKDNLVTFNANAPATATCTVVDGNRLCPVSVSYFLAPRWNQHDRTQTLGLYAQDQWTLRRLTLNLGLRWEYEGAPTERQNRNVRGFDPNASLAIASAAQAQFGNLIFGFAVTEALGIFSLLIALLLIFAV